MYRVKTFAPEVTGTVEARYSCFLPSYFTTRATFIAVFLNLLYLLLYLIVVVAVVVAVVVVVVVVQKSFLSEVVKEFLATAKWIISEKCLKTS